MAGESDPAPAPAAPPAAPPVDPPGPPAARVVMTGQRSEREINLETDLARERSAHAVTAKEKKDRETKIAELEDELYRLRHPARPKAEKSAMEEFFGD